MELEKIKPGKPMDDATWVKYLRQGNVPGKLAIKGKAIIPYDLKFILRNDGPTKGITYNILFGNYFNEAKKANSIAIVNGTPFKTDAIVCFINPPFDIVKKDAVGFELEEKKDGKRVRMAAVDRKKLANDFINIATSNGQKIAIPIKRNATVHVECSMIPVPKQAYFILQIVATDRFETPESAEEARKDRHQRFMQGFMPQKVKPNTNILDRIKAGTPKKEKLYDILVTPEMAEDILTLNTGNRQMRHDDIFNYAADMEAGNWMDTGDSTMSISSEGVLLNAQHRLMAQLKAGASVRYDIKLGVHPDAFKYIDSGRKRTGSDTASVRNLSEPTQSAATISYVLNILKYNRVPGRTKGHTISNHELDTWINTESNLAKLKAVLSSCNKIHKLNSEHLMSRTVFTGLLLLFSMKAARDAETFMELLSTGEDQGKEQNSPIYWTRKELEKIGGRGKERQKKGIEGTDIRTRWIITGWNHYRQKDPKSGNPLRIDKLKLDLTTTDLPKISR